KIPPSTAPVSPSMRLPRFISIPRENRERPRNCELQGGRKRKNSSSDRGLGKWVVWAGCFKSKACIYSLFFLPLLSIYKYQSKYYLPIFPIRRSQDGCGTCAG